MADPDPITHRGPRTKVAGIYSITNKTNGWTYVGSSYDVHNRWIGHKHRLRRGKHHSRKLQNGWNKHGEEHFAFEMVEVVTDLNLLLSREQHWIDALKAFSRHKGYNMYPTPHGRRGVKASPELRAKFSAMRKGKKMPPRSAEHMARISAAKRGAKLSPETRAKMSAARKGRKRAPFSAEHRAKLAEAKRRDKGKKLSGTALINVRAALVLRNKSPELREANRARLKRFPIARRTVADPKQSMLDL